MAPNIPVRISLFTWHSKQNKMCFSCLPHSFLDSIILPPA